MEVGGQGKILFLPEEDPLADRRLCNYDKDHLSAMEI